MQQNLDSSLSKLPSGNDATPEAQIEREELQRDYDTQLNLLKEKLFPEPVVPNWIIDDISFAVMHDPVMVRSFPPFLPSYIKLSLHPTTSAQKLHSQYLQT